ncbi:MAG: Yip1 family protein [Ferruginibacter sp.]
MNLIERVKNMLLTPKTEWEVVSGESATAASLLTSYVLPLAIVSAIGPVLGGFLFPILSMKFVLASAAVGLIVTIAVFYLSAYIVDMLAPSFGSVKDLNRSAQLVAYSSTPSYIAGLLSFIPILGGIIALGGWVYSIYVMFLGIGPMKKTLEDKKVVYLLVIYLVMIAIFFILTAVLSAVLITSLMGGIAATAL